MVTTGNRAGYSILALGVIIGLFFSYRTDRKLENFSVKQCKSNEIVYDVIINTLLGAEQRAQRQYGADPKLLAAVLASYQQSIRTLESAPKCKL